MKAIVLCAGYGTRLGNLTRALPKPMLPIAGRPLLEYTLAHLRCQGISQVAINLHFEPEKIRDHFGDGSGMGLAITYGFEPALLDTAGAVKNFESFIGEDPAVVVVYGDILSDQIYAPLIEKHRAMDACATLFLHKRARSNSIVKLADDGQIIEFIERPAEPVAVDGEVWVNSGIQILSRRVLEFLRQGEPANLPRDVYAPMALRERLYGVPHTGFRCAIDSAERYAEAIAAVQSGRYQSPFSL